MIKRQKRAVIFGITGQDGSHLADLLLSKDYKVFGISRRASTDNTQRIKHLLNHPDLTIISGDITDSFSIMAAFKSIGIIDEVYNLAAQSHVKVSFAQPGLTWDITGKGCLNILQTIKDMKLDCRFYQASSSEMFGSAYDVTSSGEKFQNENTKFLPQSPYAIAKCAAHYITRLFREAYGIHASSGILFNHEGERRGETFVTRKITKWIGDFTKWCSKHNVSTKDLVVCKNKRELYIAGRISRNQDFQFPMLRLGNLDSFRDWGYAGDFVKAMWLMLQKDKPDDYVICTGETHTVREFLDEAFSCVGIAKWENRYVYIDPEFYRPAEVDYLRGDCTKAISQLEWTPEISFKELVLKMVKSDTQLAHDNERTPHYDAL